VSGAAESADETSQQSPHGDRRTDIKRAVCGMERGSACRCATWERPADALGGLDVPHRLWPDGGRRPLWGGSYGSGRWGVPAVVDSRRIVAGLPAQRQGR